MNDRGKITFIQKTVQTIYLKKDTLITKKKKDLSSLNSIYMRESGPLT